MSKLEKKAEKTEKVPLAKIFSLLFFPVTLSWGLMKRVFTRIDRGFFSYIRGRVLRDKKRIYSIKFVWYGDSVYLHPMIWGSFLLYLFAFTGVGGGWLLLLWFTALVVCFLTIMYNFDIVRTAILATGITALMGAAYFSTIEWSWNPLLAVKEYVWSLDASVSPGFFLISGCVFTLLIASEIVWSWLFHRVEIDESYVYERRFMQSTTREPIFARGLKRETKDLLELLLLGAADIQHRTKKGAKRFSNVPFASLWLGRAVDSLLDYRRDAQIQLEADKNLDDRAEQARPSDAYHDEWDDDGGFDDGPEDGFDGGEFEEEFESDEVGDLS